MDKAIFWHRRDLRINDNAALYKALKSGNEVIPVFIFDATILEKLPADDQRVIFIYQAIEKLKKVYTELGSDLLVFYGDPVTLIPEIAAENNAAIVFANRDYEPDALKRDKAVMDRLTEAGIAFKGSKDHVIFEKNEVMKADGTPYTVFTPYMRRWKEKLNDFYLKPYPVFKYIHALQQVKEIAVLPALDAMGFSGVQQVDFPDSSVPLDILENYHETRDIPFVKGTSRMGIHLRFGTVSIRQLAVTAGEINEKYLNELIWRDFYQMIIFHFPHAANDSFKPAYDRIPWNNDERLFEAWCQGMTGYPLVDAGMRELNATGHMHNRVRMVVASFLTKHLLIDWRWGAQYFADRLLDFELASNSGGWQWAAGCGCDAAPYFRVFNPALQLEKFDKEMRYVRKWVPEYGTADYPEPIVDHKEARLKAIALYKNALNR